MIDETNKLWTRVPDHLKGGLQRYLNHRLKPGSFLEAIITNDLYRAYRTADGESFHGLREVIEYLYWDAPSKSWGSVEKFEAWLALKREENKECL